MFLIILVELINSVYSIPNFRFCLFILVTALAHEAQANSASVDSLYFREHQAMGTRFSIQMYVGGADRATELFQIAFDEIDRIGSFLSDYWPDSELSRINRSAGHAPVRTDPETFAFIKRSVEHSRRTNGAFDISIGALVEAWGFFKGDGDFPNEMVLHNALDDTGWRKLTLDSEDRTVSFTASGLRLDPGANGKGYAIDRAIEALMSHGVEVAMIEAGRSSIYALGAPPGLTGWRVNINNPVDIKMTLSTVYLRDQGLATSGGYEKYFTRDGITYSHIIDPRTGYPVQNMVQATVIARTAEEADVLSTALFVAGPEHVGDLIESYSGASAIFMHRIEDKTAVMRINWPDAAAQQK